MVHTARRGRVAAVLFGTVTAGVVLLAAGRAGAQVVIADQSADTDNSGVAVANSGGNAAAGNTSDNRARNDQRARSGDARDDSVAANLGSTGNSSDGSATVDTGDAAAVGNHSATTQSQAVDSGGRRGVVIADQDSDVDNSGLAIANTGFNLAVGNASDNRVRNEQRARSGDARDDSVAVNIGGGGNNSDGTAGITTGDAWAAGNVSDTVVSQALWADGNGGITVSDQDADVDNEGFGLANTGFNLAAGNVSDNRVRNFQRARTGDARDDSVAVNIAGGGNDSDGSAWIATGDAFAVGNLSATTVCQGLNATPVCPRAALPPVPFGDKPGPAKGTMVDKPRPHQQVVVVNGPTNLVTSRGRAEVFGVGGADLALPRTGGSFAGQAGFGALLLSVGALLRRRRDNA